MAFYCSSTNVRSQKNKNAPGRDGRMQFLWPEAQTVQPKVGEVNLSMLFVAFKDLDKADKVVVKVYPGIQSGFDFDNKDHIEPLKIWRRLAAARRACSVTRII